MAKPSRLPRRPVLVLQEHDSIWAPEARNQVLVYSTALNDGLIQAGYQVVQIKIESPTALSSALAHFNPDQTLVFNWYEGVEPNAEDGIQVLSQLDEMGFTYTGSNALAWQVGQDRLRAKHLMIAHAIPTPRYQSLGEGNLNDWALFPAIVKVANDHGSEHLTVESVVHSRADLYKRFDQLRGLGIRQLMVAEYIDGREFTVALWGNGKLHVLPLVEIDFAALPPAMPRIRTYDAKWDTTSNAYHAIRLEPAFDLERDLQNRIKRVAEAAYRAFGLRDYGRIDIRLCDRTPYVIDVNANPDITMEGSFFAAAHLGGYDYPAMLDQIVRVASERAEYSPRNRPTRI